MRAAHLAPRAPAPGLHGHVATHGDKPTAAHAHARSEDSPVGGLAHGRLVSADDGAKGARRAKGGRAFTANERARQSKSDESSALRAPWIFRNAEPPTPAETSAAVEPLARPPYGMPKWNKQVRPGSFSRPSLAVGDPQQSNAASRPKKGPSSLRVGNGNTRHRFRS
ncbi:hypothetical protein ABL78_8428 [Leptomonas seymouri]|uniref:Uncharacterized protein n=1 Tax=Leptomonas seymouri TaxID=5684 RepID=A0A0N1P9N9_LEPSE|nr:hypothetical protein ABL78_8428 [Leptomonas seymouri]|eukprot:KPI82562.1 hypothetical protein ABL78_8428 [Leptomonas seymouri]